MSEKSEKLEYPERIFSISDCHGGHRIWQPLTSPDVVEQLGQSVRSDFPEIQRFDNFGVPFGYNVYVPKAALGLHEAHQPHRRTGLFINSAPRTEKDNNGQPFYRAELDHGLRVVATPLGVLSGVRSQVRRLQRLPNENNGLYDGSKEQHRSSYTPRLLADNHGLELEEVDVSEIPELKPHCELAYIDRFGNLIISGIGREIESIRKKIACNLGETINLQVGEVQHVRVGKSLSSANAGHFIIYENDDDVEVVAKWNEDWTHEERLNNSAYARYGQPSIGTPVKILAEPQTSTSPYGRFC